MAELTECPKCKERYNKTIKMPKILSCGHTFCKECLVNYIKFSNELLCFICRQKQNLNDPGKLITNRTIYDLLYNTTNMKDDTVSSITSSNVSKTEVSFKIVMIGPAFSGKTSLVKRYIFQNFSDDYKVTVGFDFQTKTFEMNNKIINLNIWDTAGTEIFQSLTVSFYRNSAAAIVVFDIGDQKSFDSLDTWIDFYRENQVKLKENKQLIYLVGNKIDMDNRVISSEQAKYYMKSKRLTNYFEVSAKRGDNVDNLFNCIAQDIFKIYSELINGDKKPKEDSIKINKENMVKRKKCNC